MTLFRIAALGCALALAAASAGQAAPTGGFLDDQDLKIQTWLPVTPAADGPVEVADLAVYLGTRNRVAGPRGDEAHLDDVYAPEEVAPLFKGALGVELKVSDPDAKFILDTIHLAQLDLEALVKPVKLKVQPDGTGGRVRPYVRYPNLPACQHDVDDTTWHLNTSGSYPSTHAALGMLWALMMSQLAPDRTDALAAKGYAFGESRLVCGFHYSSDLAAGRLAASVLFAKLETNKAFTDRMTVAKVKLDALRGIAPAKPSPLVAKLMKLDAQRVLKPLSPVE
ncbi:phosphatase PAP2 family protein [Phenylobacterium aquaticum]|uniref:phosphatase PAP2 family protein n=1 Tax=Phenylobacterium aquaticum TaxID=1763816 RepID=UPI001F5DB47F|nr:phosphatase PAP2 family protein [Phenylobacterium aquaticum]MCI3132068.1 phosphatase PAP2 family protein [Phenylobacterium aquaticum]